MRLILCLTLATALTYSARATAAVTAPLGTATGGIAVYYNSPAENNLNLSYLRAQFGAGSLNGGAFTFDNTVDVAALLGQGSGTTFSNLFGDVGQFGFDLIVALPGNTQTIPTLTAYDNTNSGPVASGDSVQWAINDYNVNSGGGSPRSVRPIRTIPCATVCSAARPELSTL